MLLFVGMNCIPCKQLKQKLKDENISIQTVVAEENIDLVKNYNVKMVPTLVTDDGTLIKGKDNILDFLMKDDENE